MICPANFFKFLGFLRGKRAKNDLKLLTSVCFALYLRKCGSYHQDFDNDIYRCFSLYIFKKYNVINVKIMLFFIGPLQQFFLNNYLFFKFIRKCQKEILRCAPVPSSHVCDFLAFLKYLCWPTNTQTLVISLERLDLESQKLYFWSVIPASRKFVFLISFIISKFLSECFHIGLFGTPTISHLDSFLISSIKASPDW